MAEMMRKMMKRTRRALLLCLCLTLLAGAALANEVLDYCTDGYDGIGYEMTLPDGRLIFTGCYGKPGKYMDQKARILCLNPDMTVCWEYIDPAEGSCGFGNVNLMKDGTLCVLFDDSPYQTTKELKLVFFTTDGQPTGKEIPLQYNERGYVNYRILKSGLLTVWWDDTESYIGLTDWDGNTLFRWQEDEMIQFENVIEEEDGLVMIGREPGMLVNAAGKIMKADYQGNVIWETVVPFLREQNEGVTMSGIRTDDGCYMVKLAERGPGAGSPGSEWTLALVKFSSRGRILWINTEIQESLPKDCSFSDVMEYNGKYVVQYEDINRFASIGYPIGYLWFDADGNVLGTTEMSLRKEDFPRLAKKRKVEAIIGEFVPAENGLWQMIVCWDESSSHEKEMATQDDLLVRIPEL